MTDPTGKPPKRRPSRRPADEPPTDPPAPNATPKSEPESARFPVVGIGASAGGLAAFEAFFNALPTTVAPHIAIVLIQHLAPDHKSILSELIRRTTNLPVSEAEDGMEVKPSHVYIIPPNRKLTIHNRRLQLSAPTEPHGLRTPIDAFLQSLAEDQREYAIGIVLSGTGSDGTIGLRAIKAAGGLVLVQDPESATYDGMPRSAIATGVVDVVLPPAAMPAQIRNYVIKTGAVGPLPDPNLAASVADTLGAICAVLRAQTGRNFAQYKPNTLMRRIERRMTLHQITHAGDYLAYLQRQPGEVESLFNDLLIGVTSFFRDPKAFAVIQTQIIPRLISDRRPDTPIRVWVCGCSTGEEAYTLAILFQEQIAPLTESVRVQIFATDLDPQAIDQARSGVFPVGIAADITPERLTRWFVYEPEGERYRIQKTIRDMLIFSVQDVISDPPFSQLDLISCRNLLIYLNADLQKKLIPLFHYALRPGGVLFLGSSESIGEHIALFAPHDRIWKIYTRQNDRPGGIQPMLATRPAPQTAALPRQIKRRTANSEPEVRDFQALAEQALLAHSDLVGILVTERGEIVHILGRTGNYLEPAPGNAALNILTMAREGLRRELTIALHKAVTQQEPIHYPGLHVKTNGSFTAVNLTVRPVPADPNVRSSPSLFLVILEPAPVASDQAVPANPRITSAPQEEQIAVLQQELRAKEEYLQTTLEEMETANEELQSANEELQSANEELQSTNEELETSKEELQSVNEELATVNTELRQKMADLIQINNDMNNLLAGTGIGTLFVDFDLRITRFTPAITQVINLIQSDTGRPVSDIGPKLVNYDRLIEDVQQVLDTLVPLEIEVQTRSGAWYLMRIRPYRTLDNVIIGAVLTFVEISQLKQIEAALHTSEARFAKAFHSSHDGLAICRQSDGVVLDVNKRWETLTGYRRQEVVERTLLDLGVFVEPDQWQALLKQFAAQEVVHDAKLTLRTHTGEPQPGFVSLETLASIEEPAMLVILHLREREQ